MRFSSPAAASPPKTARQPTNEGVLRYVHLTDLEHRLLDAMPDNGPLRTALPWLNGSICVVLALAAVVLYRRAGRAAEAGGLWVLCLLPGIAWLMVEVAIRSMRDVEKGVGELEKLRYRYKGA